MLIQDAKRLAIGATVEDLDVVVTTAGKLEQTDKSKPKKESKQEWKQKLGITDTSGHGWAVVLLDCYKPIIKSNQLLIKSATMGEFKTKGGQVEKLFHLGNYEIPADIGEPPEKKDKFEGVLDPMVERLLEKYDIPWIDALWPCAKKNKKTQTLTTNWIIYHRYCEQIAAKAGIEFDPPELVVNELHGTEKPSRTVVVLVTGHMFKDNKKITEWSYGEASPDTCPYIPYIFAMAEKRGKDRVILKLAGFHGIVYSDAEEDWNNKGA